MKAALAPGESFTVKVDPDACVQDVLQAVYRARGIPPEQFIIYPPTHGAPFDPSTKLCATGVFWKEGPDIMTLKDVNTRFLWFRQVSTF